MTARAQGEQSALGWRDRMRNTRTAGALVWSASPRLVSAIALISLAAGLISPATAWLQREVLDALVPHGAAASHGAAVSHGGGDRSLLLLVLSLGAAAVTGAITPQAQQYLQASLRRVVRTTTYDNVYRAVASWPGIARFESPAFADKLQLAGQLAQSMASSLITSLLGVAQATVTAVTFLVTLVAINPLLGMVTAAIQCVAIVASLANAKRQSQLTLENSVRSRRQMSYSTMLSSAMSAKEVRLFGLGGFLRGRMLAELNAINTGERRLSRRLLHVESGLAALSSTVIAAGLAWTILQVAAGRLPLGDSSLFLLAAMGMQGAISQIAIASGSIAQSTVMFGAYSDVVSAPPDLAVAKPALMPQVLQHGIAVRDVWFRYDKSHPWVLRGLSLFIPAGSHVGLVGLNGSGKSTLVKLLCRLYDPEKGSICWDGTDIRDLDPAALRERITGVFQDYVLYELTAGENIGVGDLNALGDRESIRRAAESTGADADIAQLPQGYETMLSRVFPSGPKGKGARIGVMLSGGQGQRLALARALMRTDRDLLIVDEPMSSLDAEAEHRINRQLAQVQAGRTCVLISHRLASVRDADQIVVISDGSVAEQGTHADLMAYGGTYARMFTLQARGYTEQSAADNTVTGAEAGR